MKALEAVLSKAGLKKYRSAELWGRTLCFRINSKKGLE